MIVRSSAGDDAVSLVPYYSAYTWYVVRALGDLQGLYA